MFNGAKYTSKHVSGLGPVQGTCILLQFLLACLKDAQFLFAELSCQEITRAATTSGLQYFLHGLGLIAVTVSERLTCILQDLQP